MGKYEPLTSFLRGQRSDRVPLSFTEIERIVGFKLPRSAGEHRAWWSNNANNSVMTRAWLDAGFRSSEVDLAARRVVFRKCDEAENSNIATKRAAVSPRHPLYGCLKGTVKIAPGVDLTAPADP